MEWGTKWQKLPQIYAHYVYASNHLSFGTARGNPFATAVRLPCLCDARCCRTVLKALQCRCHHRCVHRCRRHRPPLRAIKSFSDALPSNSWSRANLKITYHKAPSSQYTKLFYKWFPLIWEFFRGCSLQFHVKFHSLCFHFYDANGKKFITRIRIEIAKYFEVFHHLEASSIYFVLNMLLYSYIYAIVKIRHAAISCCL